MSRQHVTELQMKACLAAMERLADALSNVTSENIGSELPTIIQNTKSDLNAIQRIDDVAKLAAIPEPMADDDDF